MKKAVIYARVSSTGDRQDTARSSQPPLPDPLNPTNQKTDQ